LAPCASAPRIVLCEPQEPGNIGAVARAMNTMGLPDLTLVAPPPEWLNEEAHGMAHSSQRLLHAAKVAPDLASAVADCALVVGTTKRRRNRDLRFLDPEETATLARAITASGSPAAIVFGNERTGLTNEQLALCHHVARVPMAVHQPSLNLAQCVMVFAYAWHRSGEKRSRARADSDDFEAASPAHSASGRVRPPRGRRHLARSDSLERMFTNLEDAIHLLEFPRNVEKRLLLSLRNLLSRAFLKEREVNLFHTLAAQIRRRAGGGTPPRGR
jgi:tRNA (cytidine32/uridine32-2'-O)-methyltransferase